MVVKHVTDQLLAAVDELAPEFIEFLGRSVQAQSVTGYEEPVVKFYEQTLRSFGWSVDTQPLADSRLRKGEKRVGKRGNIVACFSGRDTDLLVLNGHVDVVPPGDPADWVFSPFSGRVVDGRLYGRGSVDMKGGIASAVLAMRALEKSNVMPAHDVRLELVIGEETTGVGTRMVLENDPKVPKAVVVMEPSGCKIVPISTGLQFFSIAVSGRAAHTSAPWRGVDAFEKLLAVRAALMQLAEERSAKYSHELFADVPTGLPFAIGQVSAGDYPASIPAIATMSGRIGLAPGEDPHTVRTLIIDALRSLQNDDPWFIDHPPLITWGNDGLRGWETATDSDLIRSFVRAHSSLDRTPELIGFTAGSDAAFYGGAGIPTVVFGPGDVTLAHSPNEYVDVSEVIAAAKVLAIVLAGAA